MSFVLNHLNPEPANRRTRELVNLRLKYDVFHEARSDRDAPPAPGKLRGCRSGAGACATGKARADATGKANDNPTSPRDAVVRPHDRDDDRHRSDGRAAGGRARQPDGLDRPIWIDTD
jgi:hypothetical protein